jgi:hypothetical protein
MEFIKRISLEILTELCALSLEHKISLGVLLTAYGLNMYDGGEARRYCLGKGISYYSTRGGPSSVDKDAAKGVVDQLKKRRKADAFVSGVTATFSGMEEAVLETIKQEDTPRPGTAPWYEEQVLAALTKAGYRGDRCLDLGIGPTYAVQTALYKLRREKKVEQKENGFWMLAGLKPEPASGVKLVTTAEDDPKMYTAKEFMSVHKIPRSSFYRKVASGEIPYKDTGLWGRLYYVVETAKTTVPTQPSRVAAAVTAATKTISDCQWPAAVMDINNTRLTLTFTVGSPAELADLIRLVTRQMPSVTLGSV